MWKEIASAYFKALLSFILEELKRTTTDLCQDTFDSG
jgi:hypothetical protein